MPGQDEMTCLVKALRHGEVIYEEAVQNVAEADVDWSSPEECAIARDLPAGQTYTHHSTDGDEMLVHHRGTEGQR